MKRFLRETVAGLLSEGGILTISLLCRVIFKKFNLSEPAGAYVSYGLAAVGVWKVMRYLMMIIEKELKYPEYEELLHGLERLKPVFAEKARSQEELRATCARLMKMKELLKDWNRGIVLIEEKMAVMELLQKSRIQRYSENSSASTDSRSVVACGSSSEDVPLEERGDAYQNEACEEGLVEKRNELKMEPNLGEEVEIERKTRQECPSQLTGGRITQFPDENATNCKKGNMLNLPDEKIESGALDATESPVVEEEEMTRNQFVEILQILYDDEFNVQDAVADPIVGNPSIPKATENPEAKLISDEESQNGLEVGAGGELDDRSEKLQSGKIGEGKIGEQKENQGEICIVKQQEIKTECKTDCGKNEGDPQRNSFEEEIGEKEMKTQLDGGKGKLLIEGAGSRIEIQRHEMEIEDEIFEGKGEQELLSQLRMKRNTHVKKLVKMQNRTRNQFKKQPKGERDEFVEVVQHKYAESTDDGKAEKLKLERQSAHIAEELGDPIGVER